jgi:hypothetical protein
MRRSLFLLLLLVPLAAAANEHPCAFQAPRNLNLDLTGVRAVQIQLDSEDLNLTAGGNASHSQLTGRACASSQRLLDALQVTQHREGDQLIIETGGRSDFTINLMGESYTYLDLNLQLPASMPVTLHVDSGDADVTGLAQLRAIVDSGDLHVRGITGRLTGTLGSGDVQANDIGSLHMESVASGDFKVHGVHGDAQIGSVGSGDVSLYDVKGSVRVDTLGSGDLKVRDVSGDFTLGAKGSGDVSHSGVNGKVSVPHDDDDDN